MVQQGSEYSLEVSKSVPNRNVRLTLTDSPLNDFLARTSNFEKRKNTLKSQYILTVIAAFNAIEPVPDVLQRFPQDECC